MDNDTEKKTNFKKHACHYIKVKKESFGMTISVREKVKKKLNQELTSALFENKRKEARYLNNFLIHNHVSFSFYLARTTLGHS